MLRRAFIIAVPTTFALLLMPATGTSSSLAERWHTCVDEPLQAERDLRNEADKKEPVTYRLVLICRYSGPNKKLPGHAFVILGEYDDKAKVCKEDGLYGLYAKSDLQGAMSYFIGKAPGTVMESPKDRDLNLSVHRLDLVIGKAQHGRVTKVIDEWTKKAKEGNVYKAGDQDCVTFTRAVAEALHDSGLATLDRKTNELPVEYLRRLVEANLPKQKK